MATLNVRSGLSAPLVNSIPTTWDPQWFRRFITDYLNVDQVSGGGAVTSIIAGIGIAVSGPTGDVTVTNDGVTSIIAGTGIVIAPTDGVGDVTVNASVAGIGGGPGISVSSSPISVSWSLGMVATSSAAIYGIASDASGNTLAVDANGIVYKSTDGGNTWITFSSLTVTGPGTAGGNMAWAGGTFVFAHDPTSIKKSTDGGVTWTSVATGITGTFTPGYAANNGSGVWVITSNANPGTTHCYSVSTDNAITFSVSANTSTPDFPNAPALWDGSQFVAFDALTPSVITSPTGTTWTPTTSNNPNLQWASLAVGGYVCAAAQTGGVVRVASTHGGLGTASNTTVAGLGVITTTAANGGTVFAFDSNGTAVGVSLDSGATWTFTSSNFPTGDRCSAVCFDAAHQCFIAGGFLGGVITSVNSTLSSLVTISLTGGSGTVTSVGVADTSTSPIFAVTNTPVTTSGTIDLTLVTQSPHNVFAGPATGSTAAQPTFRLLVAGDLPAQANNTVLGNVSGGSAVPIALSQTQLTTQVNVFTTSLSGAVPASGGGTTNFLRADGTFAAPAGAGGVTSISFGSTGLTPSTATTGAVVVAGTLAIGSGGTGQTAKAAAYNALSPMTTVGDLEYEASGPTAARLAIGSTGQVLTVVSGLPAWAPANAGTVTSIGSTTLTIAGTSAVPTVNLSTAQVTNIAAGGTALQTVSVIDSISGAGTSGSPLQLVGDSATPGNTMLYGTNGSGTKGWYAQPSAGGVTSITGTANQIAASASTGAVTLSFPVNVVIPTPTSGNALMITAATASLGIVINQGASTAAGFQVSGPSGSGGGINIVDGGAGNRTWSLFAGNAGTGLFSIFDNTGGAARVVISTNGATTVGNVLGLGLLNVAATASAVYTSGPWDNTWFLVGPNTTSGTGAALGLGYNSSGAHIMSLAPASAWESMFIDGATLSLNTFSTGQIVGYGTVAAAAVNMSPDASTFTGTLTGMTTTVTNTCVWSRQGNQVTLYFGTGSGTGNTGSLTMTGIPAAIQPARAQTMAVPSVSMNNIGVVGANNYDVTISGGTATFFINASSSGWTAISAKGISTAFSVTYAIN